MEKAVGIVQLGSSLSIETYAADGAVRVVVSGEIDLATRDRLHGALEWLEACGEDVIVVDVSAVSFIDASGLHALVDARDSARMRGATLEIADPSPALRRLLELTGIEDLVEARPVTDGTA